MSTKSYSSIQKIKEFAMEDLAPKYFNMDSINDLHIGLLGFTTEYLSTIAEDSFNTVLMYMNEMFPHLAVMPETIYNNGTLFQIDGSFASPSSTGIYLFIPENTVLTYGVRESTSTSADNAIYNFYLDSDMIINIEDIHFKPDYNIKISYKYNSGDYIFTAKYVFEKHGGSYKNSLSSIATSTENPYIKLKRINFQNTKYLQIEIQAHQVDKHSVSETIVTNDTINSPTFNVEFEGKLANFEVFYKGPSDTNYTQLVKRLSGSPAITEKFCYYKMVDEGEFEITFTTRDGYFIPEYNSELLIEYYTTLGAEGNFDEYTGNAVSVYLSSEVYQYNNNIAIFAFPVTGAFNGADPLSISQIKNLTIEKFSTIGSYSTENDLQLYFNNFNANFNSNILFLKTRDDIFERLFSAFTILKNKDSEILSTNTLNLTSLLPDTIENGGSFDSEVEQNKTFILKPGHLFEYSNNNTLDSVSMRDGSVSDENLVLNNQDFIYTNPFLIYLSKSPMIVGYYMNSVNAQYSVDYDEAAENSIIQFICTNLTITRDAITENIVDENGSKIGMYNIGLIVTPTSTLDNAMVEQRTEIYNIIGDGNTTEFILPVTFNNVYKFTKSNPIKSIENGTTLLDSSTYTFTPSVDGSTGGTITFDIAPSLGLSLKVTSNVYDFITESIKVKLYVTNDSGDNLGYVNMNLDTYDTELNVYKFSGNIKTNDTITGDNFTIINLIDEDGQMVPSVSAPMSNNIIKIHTEYKYKDSNNYTLTNKYSTTSNPVTFIKPINMIHSVAEYIDTSTTDNPDSYTVNIKSVPLIKAELMRDETNAVEFYNIMETQHNYLTNIVDKITNNFSVDIKFYNTYGRSKNFYIEDTVNNVMVEKVIDKVNITIKFKVNLAFGVNEEELIRDIKIFIKDYIENINENGTNSIYISNLIRELENNFTDINYLKFIGINNYNSMVQSIENMTVNLTELSKVERMAYVPEYLTLSLDDIEIELI